MTQRDWKSLVDRTIAAHLASLRSPNPEEERRRRARAGDELNALALWAGRNATQVAAATRNALPPHGKNDAAWVALTKHYLRQGCATDAKRGALPGFARALDTRRKGWLALAGELLAGVAASAVEDDDDVVPAPPVVQSGPRIAPTKPAPARVHPAATVEPPVQPHAPAPEAHEPAPHAAAAPTPAARPAPPAQPPRKPGEPAAGGGKKGKKGR